MLVNRQSVDDSIALGVMARTGNCALVRKTLVFGVHPTIEAKVRFGVGVRAAT